MHEYLIIKSQLRLLEKSGNTKALRTLEQNLPNTNASKVLRDWVTQDPDMLLLKDFVELYSLESIKDPVLIQGETGTGKETIARALHGNRPGKFCAINVTALPDLLVESELFGHRRGSFTGADRDRDGLFIEAKDGTIFLDEIGDMPKNTQAKLLRVLQEGTIKKVGDNQEIPVNCRVICATNKTDKLLLGRKKFREDLFYRISCLRVNITPLRERIEDLELLRKKYFPHIKNDVMMMLFSFENGEPPENFLPGNVREFLHIMRRHELIEGYTLH